MSTPVRARQRPAFAKLTALTAVATAVLVVLGGAVRATDSGLACPTWPGCFSAGDFVPPAGLNVWLEHSHRLLAGVVALLIAAQLIWVLARLRRDRVLLALSVAAAVLVNVQAVLGALVVWNLLRPGLVTTHLGLALAVFALQIGIAVRAAGPTTHHRPAVGYRRRVLGVAALAYVTILVGGQLTGTGAGLAFRDQPLLGLLAFGPLDGLGPTVNVAHRVLAVLLTLAVLLLVREARRVGLTGWAGRLPAIALALVGLQILVGVANLASGLSWVAVIPHLAVASWIWVALVLHAALLLRPGPVARPSDEPRVAEAVPA